MVWRRRYNLNMANTEECTIAWNDISKAFGLNGDGPKDEFEHSTIGK